MWLYIHHVINNFSPKENGVVEQVKNHITEKIHLFNNYLTDDLNIILRFDPKDVISGMRTAWYTNTSYMVSIVLDTDIKKWFDQDFFSELTSCITHEVHHIVRRSNPWYWELFWDVIVSEWLACLAEVEQNPQHNILYIQAEDEEIKKLITRANDQWENYDHRERYFGAWKLPNRAGYKLWYYLLSQYAKIKNLSSWDLVHTKWKNIIEDEDFKNLINL